MSKEGTVCIYTMVGDLLDSEVKLKRNGKMLSPSLEKTMDSQFNEKYKTASKRWER